MKKLQWKDLFKHLEKYCDFKKDAKGKDTWTCNGKLTATKQFCEKNKLNYEAIKFCLQNSGGYCDCEVLFNSTEHLLQTFELPLKRGLGE